MHGPVIWSRTDLGAQQATKRQSSIQQFRFCSGNNLVLLMKVSIVTI